MPIKELKVWFDEFIVTKKREDISLLIKKLMLQHNKDPSCLPEIVLPTLNGALVEFPEDEEDGFEDEEEEYRPSDEEFMHESMESEELENSDPQVSGALQSIQANYKEEGTKTDKISIKFSSEKSERLLAASTSTPMKPDTSDMTSPSNREALSYLKAKRIIKDRGSSTPDPKKFKGD